MKPFVFVGILVALLLGGFWGLRRWVGPSSETVAPVTADEAMRASAKAAEARAAIPIAPGTLAPGEVPGPRGDTAGFTPPPATTAPSGSVSAGGGAVQVNPELNEAGFPKFQNTGPDGRFDTGEPAPPSSVRADGRQDPDPFPEPPPGSPETNAYSDLPPPPPPRMAEDGYQDGSSPSFPGDPAFSDSESF